MPRLYRPHVPLNVRLRVVGRQLGWSEGVINESVRSAKKAGELGSDLTWALGKLANDLHCDVKDLRLDHDPALGARPRRRRGLGRKTYYIPDANDPDHLFYRPHGPEHAGSHLIKTNVRGDHGQHPDRVLIKKARRAEKRDLSLDADGWPTKGRSTSNSNLSRKRETPAKASGFPKASARSKRVPGFEPAFASGRIEDAHERVYYRATKRVGGTKHQWPKRSFAKRSKPR